VLRKKLGLIDEEAPAKPQKAEAVAAKPEPAKKPAKP
jgi:hypothetical protein